MKKKSAKKKIVNDHLILHISLVLNVILGVAIISWLIYSNSPSGRLDAVNNGNRLMCNGQFEADYPDADSRLLQYTCGKGGAQSYFNKGFEDYKHSLGE